MILVQIVANYVSGTMKTIITYSLIAHILRRYGGQSVIDAMFLGWKTHTHEMNELNRLVSHGKVELSVKLFVN